MSRKILKTCLLGFILFLLSLNVAFADEGEYLTVEGMQGVSPHKDTVITVSGTYSSNYGKNSIDGNLNTLWNAGTYKGTIQYVFPEPINLSFIQIAAYSNPKSNNYYTIYGLKDGKWTAVSSKVSRYVNLSVTVTDPIEITPGEYDGIKVEVDGSASWAHVNELTLGITESTNPIQFNLQATGGNTQVGLKWDEIASAESYTIRYGTESGKYTETVTATKDEYGNFVIPGLTNGTTYYFVVSAIIDSVESEFSNEASATPQGPVIEPEEPSGNRAILVVTMTTGLEKEYDLSMQEVNSFIDWYETKQAGSGKASYAIDKHDNNKGPFKSRKDYILFDRVLTFEVSEY
ncbi:fibronectin type III domain-containing protein [Paenibacillus amylolyticus]|uniref:Fibronectin type III domain-containing protein n=1 Tax=Paenibacillus amylolyticus TaxID=1451 RepID=A0ABD8AZ68_PAEAM